MAGWQGSDADRMTEHGSRMDMKGHGGHSVSRAVCERSGWSAGEAARRCAVYWRSCTRRDWTAAGVRPDRRHASCSRRAHLSRDHGVFAPNFKHHPDPIIPPAVRPAPRDSPAPAFGRARPTERVRPYHHDTSPAPRSAGLFRLFYPSSLKTPIDPLNRVNSSWANSWKGSMWSDPALAWWLSGVGPVSSTASVRIVSVM